MSNVVHDSTPVPEATEYVYFVANDETGAVEGGTLQSQIVFATAAETIPNVEETYAYEPSTSEFASSDSQSDIWSKCNNALRDLLVFLVRKHRIEDVMDSKVKAAQWEKLISDFFAMINGDETIVSRQQVIRKWHNWKQYNKAKKKPHPFAVTPELSLEVISDKVQKLLLSKLQDERILHDEDIDLNAPILLQSYQATNDGQRLANPLTKLKKIRSRDFFVRRTGASASFLSAKRLEHELILESLNFEQEKWRMKAETQMLRKEKLTKKIQITDTRLELAKLELELLRNQASKKS